MTRTEDGGWRTNAYAVPLVGGPDGGAYTTTADLVYGRTEQDLTLVDAVSLHLMRDGAVGACWSTDRHLGLTGAPLAIRSV